MLHYLMLAHKNPKQVAAFTNRINNKDSKIYIHLDLHSDLNDYCEIKKKVIFIKNRVKVRRNAYSIFQAIINGIEEIYPYTQKGDHIIICSGEDYPIKSNEYINEFFKKNEGKSFIDATPNDKCKNRRDNHYKLYHYYDLVIPDRIDNIIRKPMIALGKRMSKKNIPEFIWDSRGRKLHIAEKTQVTHIIIERIVNLFRKKKTFISNNYKVRIGSCRMALSYEHIKYLLDFYHNEKKQKFFEEMKTSIAPDEMLIHTVLFENKNILEKIENKKLWYIQRKEYKTHPEIINENNLKEILTTEQLYARKVNLDYYNLDTALIKNGIFKK